MIERLLSKLNIRHDLALHALYGLILYNVLAIYDYGIALIVVICIAVGKEVYDSFHLNHTSDKIDALATAIIPTILTVIEMWR